MHFSKIIGYVVLTIVVAFICKMVYWNIMPKTNETEGMTHRNAWRMGPPYHRHNIVYTGNSSGYYGYGYPFYYETPIYATTHSVPVYDPYPLTLFMMFTVMVVAIVIIK
jgi:hypothetical protein